MTSPPRRSQSVSHHFPVPEGGYTKPPLGLDVHPGNTSVGQAPKERDKTAPVSFRQRLVLSYLKDNPTATIREIAANADYASSSSAFYAFGELRRQGLIRQAQCECCETWRWVVPE
jgi:hypothetical protein